MRKQKRVAGLARAIGVITAVGVLVTGVTFAALQSQNAVLQGSKITSATANLTIGDGQGGFVATTPGFEFNNVEPGGPAMPQPAHELSLRNNGTSNLALRLSMNPNSFFSAQGANIDHIFIVLKPHSGGMSQTLSLTSLMTAYTNNQPMDLQYTAAAGQQADFTIQVQMSADAVPSTLSGITLRGIDLIFSGTSVVS